MDWSSEAARGGLLGAGRSGCGLRGNQSDHSYQVVGGRHQIARQLGPRQAAIARAAESTYGLHPAKDLLDARADALADDVSHVTRRAPIDRAAPTASVLGDVWRDLTPTEVSDESSGVVALVGAQRPWTKPALARLFDQLGHGVPLGCTRRLAHLKVHHQPMPILHQRVAHERQV